MAEGAKHTNSEIVKSLIVLTQDFINHQPANIPTSRLQVDETNLVNHISAAMSAYRRQRDRIADVYQDMERIVEG